MPLLNDAKTCYVGTTPITKIMAGDLQVWPKEVYPPKVDVLHYFTCDNTLNSLPPYQPGGLIPIDQGSGILNPVFSPDGKLNQCLLYQHDGTDMPNTNGSQIDESTTGEEQFNLIHFMEAYVKIGLVTASTSSRAYSARLVLSAGTPFYRNNAASIDLQPMPDGTMKVREVMNSTYQNAPAGGYEDITYIPYTEPAWLHVSVSLVAIIINQSSGAGSLESYFSVNGIVNQNSMGLNGFTQQLPMTKVSFDVYYKGNAAEPFYPESVLIDEIRTASTPLYTQDFNPS